MFNIKGIICTLLYKMFVCIVYQHILWSVSKHLLLLFVLFLVLLIQIRIRNSQPVTCSYCLLVPIKNTFLCTLFPTQNQIFNKHQAKNTTPGQWRYESLFILDTYYISIYKNTMQWLKNIIMTWNYD